MWRNRRTQVHGRDLRSRVAELLGDTHALDTDAHCTVDPPDGKPPAALGFVPLENLLRDARRILRATHNATTTRRHEQTSICVAVHTHLTKR